LIQWIISDDQPFTVVEGGKFKEMIFTLNSAAKIPSADTIKNHIMKKFKTEQEKIRNKLQVTIYLFIYIIFLKLILNFKIYYYIENI
jgi:hypothetical protein